MNDITIRFLEIYNYLKSKNKVLTPKGFAAEIGVSTSLITEICKERTNAGLTPIQNLITRFEEISPEWLLTGKGSMLKEASTTTTLEEPGSQYGESSEMSKEKAAFLIEQIEFYKTKSEFLAYQLKAKKIPEGKELEEGMKIIDKIEEALSKKFN